MKAFILSGLIFLIALSSRAQTTQTAAMKHQAQLKEKIALACKLTDRDQIKRMNELHQTLFKKVDKTVEHKNSYELIFQHPDDKLNTDLAEFIKFERLCCPWLLFHLTLQPGEGPVSLEMGNSTETKEMVKLVMGLDKLEGIR